MRLRKPAALVLSLVGLFDSLYLLWVYASPSHPMLCLGTGCDVVRASRYAHLWGYPLPAFGVAMYAILVLLIIGEPLVGAPVAVWLRRATALTAAAGFVTAVYLTAIEAFVLHAWCAWCVTQAIAVTLLFAVSLTLLRSADADPPAALATVRGHAIVLLVAVLAGVPTFFSLTRRAEVPPPALTAAPLTAAQAAALLVRPDSHITGDPQSPITLVEFGDLQCPACAQAAPEIRQLRQRFGSRVRFVFRQFPLQAVHQYALHSALASECAGEQGKFWQAVDRFYDANGDLKDASLQRYATQLGLDMGKFNACLASPATLARVQGDVADGHALGVRATPTFFLGQQRIEGALPLAQFAQLLEHDLAAAAPPPPPASAPSAQPVPAAAKQKAEKPAAPAAAGFNPGSAATSGFFNLQGASTDCSENGPTGPEPNLIRTARAQQLYRAGSLFVDVRSAEDFRKAHIAGAKNLPLIEFAQRVNSLPRDRTIVLYEASAGSPKDVCAASKSAARVLLIRGYTKVAVYQDGLAGWQGQSLPVEP